VLLVVGPLLDALRATTHISAAPSA
jgi:hypothetical protein